MNFMQKWSVVMQPFDVAITVARRRHTALASHRHTLRLRNDLYCVEWGVKLYSLTHSSSHTCYTQSTFLSIAVTEPRFTNTTT